MLTDDPVDALTHLRRAWELALQTARPDLMAATLNNLALAHRRAGDLERRRLPGPRPAVLDPVGDRHRLAALHSNLADTFHQAGDDEGPRLT